MGTEGDNTSDKAKNDLPTGVRHARTPGKFYSQVELYLNLTNHFSVRLGTYDDVATTERAFLSVSKQRVKIVKELEGMLKNSTSRKDMIAYVKSYISLV
jgi:hypothetical protein